MGTVGRDGVTPGVSQHLGLGQTPRAVCRGGSPPLCGQPRPGQLPLHGEGQTGSRQQDMPLARKLSKQAAPVVCSPARWRILFPVPSLLPPAHSPPRGCSGASKPPLGQGIQGIASASSREGIADGSSLRPRPWGGAAPQQSSPSHAVPLAGGKPPTATGSAKLPVLGAGEDQGRAVPPPAALRAVAGTA